MSSNAVPPAVAETDESLTDRLAGRGWFPGSPIPPDDAHEGLATPLPWYLTDHLRSALTFGCYFASKPWLAQAPVGDGHPVLVFPGLGAGDLSTLPMRRFLRGLGYEIYGWGFGINIGPTRRVVNGLGRLVGELADRHQQKVSVIGWSLGGLFARSTARQSPDAVRQVITLGSPFRMGHPRQARAIRFYQRFTPFHVPTEELPQPDAVQPRLPVPATSILSRLDGIVDWRACVDDEDDRHQNIGVWASHLGYGHDPAVLWAIADRLAQPADDWQPFQPPWYAAPLYPPV